MRMEDVQVQAGWVLGRCLFPNGKRGHWTVFSILGSSNVYHGVFLKRKISFC